MFLSSSAPRYVMENATRHTADPSDRTNKLCLLKWKKLMLIFGKGIFIYYCIILWIQYEWIVRGRVTA